MQYDLTHPNSGRMLDYWLGGKHNFEIDRQLADQVSQRFPLLPEMARKTRAVMGRTVQWLYDQGIHTFIDFGSSLPTCGNTHLVAHAIDPQLRVIYSDIDPIIVAYGQELLAGDPCVLYVQADAAQPQQLLEHPDAQLLLNGERRAGLLFVSLEHLLPDDVLRTAWRTLYDWVAPDSYLFVYGPSVRWNSDPDLLAINQMYARADVKSYYRTTEQLCEMAQPWQPLPDTDYTAFNVWDTSNPTIGKRLLNFSIMFHKLA